MNKKVLLLTGSAVLLSLISYLLGAKLNKPVPKLENGKEVVLSVDGKEIIADDFYNEMKKQNGTAILLNMIDRFIVSEELETTSAIEGQVKSQIEQMKYSTEQSGQNWLQYLAGLYAQYGIKDEATLYDYFLLAIKKEEIVKTYLEKKVTDAEINTYYEKNIFGEIVAKHILIKPDTTSTMTTTEVAAEEAKALETAKEVIAKLEAGEKWNDLVAKYTDDAGTKEDNGELSFNKADVVSEFWNASKALTDGAYTKTPVKSEFGYHIIMKVSEEAKPKLETVKVDVIDGIIEDKLTADTALSDKTFLEIRKNYNIKITDPLVLELYDNYKSNLSK